MRVAVFDLDGTLADTAADLIAAGQRRARRGRASGGPLDPAARRGGRLRRRAGDAAARGSPGRTAGSTRRRSSGSTRGCWRSTARRIAVETRLYDGAAAALERLAATGWGLAVCTNKPEGLAVRLLDALGIGGRFRGGARRRHARLAQARPAAPDRDDRAGGRRAGAGGAGRRHGQRPRGGARRRGCPACWSASGPRAPGSAALEPEALLAHFDDLPELLERLVPTGAG